MALSKLRGGEGQCTETNWSAQIRNRKYWDSPSCLVHLVTWKRTPTEVAFPNMSNGPHPLWRRITMSAPHTGESSILAHIDHQGEHARAFLPVANPVGFRPKTHEFVGSVVPQTWLRLMALNKTRIDDFASEYVHHVLYSWRKT